MKKKKSRSQPKKKEEIRRSVPPALSSAKSPGSTPPPSVTDTPASSEKVAIASEGRMFPATAAGASSRPPDPREDSGLQHRDFFAPPPPRLPQGMGLDDDLDEPKLRVFSPEAKERRKRNVRVVKWFVGGCLALTAIAAVRHALRTEEPPAAPLSVSAAQTSSAPPEPTAATPTPSSSIATGASVAADADAVAATTTVTDASAASSIPDNPEEARQERDHAKKALESGRMKEAVAAGERAVTLDPTDADSWLYLGAAYQEQGDQANANRCYRACLTQGTHGNKGECSAMMK